MIAARPLLPFDGPVVARGEMIHSIAQVLIVVGWWGLFVISVAVLYFCVKLVIHLVDLIQNDIRRDRD